MKKIMIIDGGPRKNMNTAAMNCKGRMAERIMREE